MHEGRRISTSQSCAGLARLEVYSRLHNRLPVFVCAELFPSTDLQVHRLYPSANIC